jgi:predicted transcriptional regulator
MVAFYPQRLQDLKLEAIVQNNIMKVLVHENKECRLKEISYKCPYTYHQVASALTALISKGYVKRVGVGKYEATESAKIFELDKDYQIQILQKKVIFLENELKNLTDRFVRASYR